MDQILKIEINTLFSIIDELTYYQILRLTPDCIQSDIEPAYQEQGRHFHPQKFETAPEELKAKGQYVFLSIKEAYETLRDIAGRLKYDHLLAEGQLRIENTKLLNTQENQINNDPSQAATNENAKKYWQLALHAYDNDNYAGAAMQIKFALQFEPNNDVFIEWLQKCEEKAKAAPKKSSNPYKIRL